MESMHKIYNNIDRSFELFGRSMADWMIIGGVSLSMMSLVYNRLPIHDIVRGLLGIATGWVMMQLVTGYRDNYPPKMAQYVMEWITQADNYIVAPDLMATPLSADDELIALEEDRLAEQREMIKDARQDRSRRRRNALPLQEGVLDASSLMLGSGSEEEDDQSTQGNIALSMRGRMPVHRVARPVDPSVLPAGNRRAQGRNR